MGRRGVRRSKSGLSAEALRIEELERELVLSKQGMGAMVEEQQAPNEELQSTNEELFTVNSELRSKVEQLTSMQDDMKNLLDNISVGAIFLDRELMIRRFTHGATSVYRLVATDLGRPLADIRSELRDVDLLGHSFYVVGGRLWNVAPMHDLLDTVPPAERTFEARELTHVIPGVGPRNLRFSARRVTENGGSTELSLLSIEVLPDHSPQT